MAKLDHAKDSRIVLAEAQRRLSDAEAELAALKSIDKWELTASTRQICDDAEQAVIAAARHDVEDMIAKKRGLAVPERKSRMELHDELTAARAAVDVAQDARRDLERREDEAGKRVQRAESAVSSSIRDLLEASPEAAALVEEITATENRLIELYHALNVIGGPTETRTYMNARLVAKSFTRMGVPDWDMLPAMDSEMVAAWRAAVSALRTNANVALPGGAVPESKARRRLFQTA